MGELAYVNGEFCELSEARVSIEDRGFQFADAVYEGIVAYRSEPFRLPQHLARLRRSADQIRLKLPHTDDEIESIIREGIRKYGFGDVFIYVQVTRGVAPRIHAFPAKSKPTVVMTFKPRPILGPGLRENGVQLITLPDDRWGRCFIKSVVLLPNVLAKQEAIERGAFDAIFVGPEEIVYEATAANIFVVRDQSVLTPAGSDKILPGITRDYIVESLPRIGLKGGEPVLHKRDLFEADEVFLSGSTTEVLGVTRIDDRPIADGRVGPITRKIYQKFFAERSTAHADDS